MIDPFGRKISYLRVSVTDRCDLRCTYCMAENMTFLPKAEILSLEELDRICTSFVDLGVEKLRITGGEPLVRKDVMTLFKALSRHLDSGRLKELTLTTNGTQLDRFAADLAACGVKRINVSLDSLDPDKFRQISRRGDLGQVMAGLRAAQKADLKIKINTVAMRGVNDDEVDYLVSWCGSEGFDLTFIETMPMGEVEGHRADRYLSLEELKQQIAAKWTLQSISDDTGGPARYIRVNETGQRIGFITPMSHNFCESCNRVRLTCTGTLYMCLGQDDAVDLRQIVRNSESNAPLTEAIQNAIAHKPKGHDFVIDRDKSSISVQRHMSVTGG